MHFLSLSAVYLSLRDGFCFSLELLRLSENGYPWILAWTIHTEKTGNCLQRVVTGYHCARDVNGRQPFNKLWVSGTGEDRTRRGAESSELGVKLQEGKEIQEL